MSHAVLTLGIGLYWWWCRFPFKWPFVGRFLVFPLVVRCRVSVCWNFFLVFILFTFRFIVFVITLRAFCFWRCRLIRFTTWWVTGRWGWRCGVRSREWRFPWAVGPIGIAILQGLFGAFGRKAVGFVWFLLWTIIRVSFSIILVNHSVCTIFAFAIPSLLLVILFIWVSFELNCLFPLLLLVSYHSISLFLFICSVAITGTLSIFLFLTVSAFCRSSAILSLLSHRIRIKSRPCLTIVGLRSPLVWIIWRCLWSCSFIGKIGLCSFCVLALLNALPRRLILLCRRWMRLSCLWIYCHPQLLISINWNRWLFASLQFLNYEVVARWMTCWIASSQWMAIDRRGSCPKMCP